MTIDLFLYGPLSPEQISDALIREMESFSDEELNDGVTIAVTLEYNGHEVVTYAVNSWDFEDEEDVLREMETGNVSYLADLPSRSNRRELLNSLTSLDDLMDVLEQDDLLDLDSFDWTELPTFGGKEPQNTEGVWSWDKKRVLVGTSFDDLSIEHNKDVPWIKR